jgi:16S rRNA G966 N2-methylase RsmD
VNLGYIKAKTHGPEYSWHKYWSRKPANVISAYLKDLVPENGVVIDPFCGSGVVLLEAQKLGFDSIGIDVNPSARAISGFLTHPVKAEEFKNLALNMLEDLESTFGIKYTTLNGEAIRYLVHHVQVRCSKCSSVNTFDPDTHGKNGKKCDKCGNKLSFGIANLIGTQIVDIVCVNSLEVISSEEIARQTDISSQKFSSTNRYDKSLVNNKRTLTSDKYGVGSYFTPRNFSILSEFAERAHAINNEAMKKALLLVLTASSAQASRLIASRGGLKTGGQAWTIPGFWIPPVHLESNPFIHLRARIEKMYSALLHCETDSDRNASVTIMAKSAKDGLRDLLATGVEADLIFLDPPYGDSVAFLEFSAIWNAFMDEAVSYADDISVSDRTNDPMTGEKYLEELTTVFGLVRKILKADGKALLTFNNISLFSWKGIIESFQNAGLVPLEVNYQDPAVISSKSQKAIGGSYIGDFYVVYGKDDKTPNRYEDLVDALTMYLHKVAGSRGGRVLYPLLQRYALEFWLENNLRAQDLYQIDELIDSEFTKDGSFLVSNSNVHYPTLSQIMLEQIESCGANQISIDDNFLIRTKAIMREYGTPSFYEIRALLDSVIDRKIGDTSPDLQLTFDFN